MRPASPFNSRSACLAAGLCLLMAGLAAGAEPPVAPPASPVVAPAKPGSVPNSECMDCHEAEFTPRKKGQAPEWIGVKPEVFAKSVHAKLNCVDCHTSIEETPHPSKLPPAQCATCHEKAAGQ